jgi:hypothetical protein
LYHSKDVRHDSCVAILLLVVAPYLGPVFNKLRVNTLSPALRLTTYLFAANADMHAASSTRCGDVSLNRPGFAGGSNS